MSKLINNFFLDDAAVPMGSLKNRHLPHAIVYHAVQAP